MEEDDPTNVEAEILTEDDEQELTELVLEALNAEADDLSEEEIATIAGWLVLQVSSKDYESEPLKKRAKPVERDREFSWNFIMSWTDQVFRKQFRMDKDQFMDLVMRCKEAYPGKYMNGLDNYKLALIRGDASSPTSGAICMELKVAILFISLTLCSCRSLKISFYLYRSLILCLTHGIPLCHSLSHSNSHSLYLSLSLSFALLLSLTLCLSHCFFLSLSLSLSLFLTHSQSLLHCHCHSLSL
jgi:hypothetical protein